MSLERRKELVKIAAKGIPILRIPLTVVEFHRPNTTEPVDNFQWESVIMMKLFQNTISRYTHGVVGGRSR
jgi:hypothetical protein